MFKETEKEQQQRWVLCKKFLNSAKVSASMNTCHLLLTYWQKAFQDQIQSFAEKLSDSTRQTNRTKDITKKLVDSFVVAGEILSKLVEAIVRIQRKVVTSNAYKFL